MRVLNTLSTAFAVALLAAGCSLFPTGPALSEKAPRALAYQLGEESRALVIPVSAAEFNSAGIKALGELFKEKLAGRY